MGNQQPNKNMAEKISITEFKELVRKMYDTDIEITQWSGWSQPLAYICPICSKRHYTCHAYIILHHTGLCMDDWKQEGGSTFSEKFFIQKVERLHPNQIEIISYKGLGQPLYYKCKRCGQTKSLNAARKAIGCIAMCPDCDGREKSIIRKTINTFFKQTKDYKLISWTGQVGDKVKIQCLKCQAIFERYPSNMYKSLDVCPNCNNGKIKQRLDSSIIQQRIDDKFGIGQYTLLDYEGQLSSHSKVRCENCGFIFDIRISSFLTQETRGCPKCKRFHSKGEQMVEAYLKASNIPYETQKRYPDCNGNLSSFDFCAYDKQGQECLIEVNGIQHYQDKKNWGSSWTLKDNQRRDKIKSDYCEKTGKKLIIIPYYDLSDEKIDNYLSFLKGSTTIAPASNQEIQLEEMNNT